MKSNGRKCRKNDAAFTGLEAAIVLIAFVVVAAVFSYVMLGAGFFTSQKSKEVVHTGVDQATSSLELAGDIIGEGTPAAGDDAGTLDAVDITLSLTAGNNPVDVTKLIVTFKDDTDYVPAIWDGSTATESDDGAFDGAGYYWVQTNSKDNMLDQFEKVELHIEMPDSITDVGKNTKISFEIKPATGAILPITVTTPPVITKVMTLI
jgi:flagellin FlaB